MAKALTTTEILKLWCKSTLLSVLFALVIQAITTQMGNGNENLPSPEECEDLKTKNSMSRFKSFEQFYPFYLCEHTLGKTKLFHFITSINVIVILAILLTRKWQWKLFMFGLLQGYGTAWISHFFIEQNRPATFTYPVYSFFADFKMFSEIVMLRYPPFL